MAVPLTTITIPTLQPYDPEHPDRNRENYAYVQIQLLQAAKDAGESVSFNTSAELTVDLTDLIAAIEDLSFTGERIDIPALGIILQRLGKTLAIITQ